MKRNAATNIKIVPKISKFCRLVWLYLRLSVQAIKKPQYIALCWWAFQQLWWVDSRLKDMALNALKIPADPKPQHLTLQLTREIRRRARAIAYIGKIHPLRPKCLHRSLVLHHWLQQQGINAQLEIGWGDRIGHAWVTYNGIVLNDRSDIATVTPRLVNLAVSSQSES